MGRTAEPGEPSEPGRWLGATVGPPLTEPSMLCSLLQFWLTMSYLSQMTEEQTLVMYSGHPLGLFPSSPGAPRLVITNGMVGPGQPARCRRGPREEPGSLTPTLPCFQGCVLS